MVWWKYEKATICVLGAYGASVREVKALEVRIKRMAQYPSAIEYTYVDKGKRRRIGYLQGRDPNLVVFDGWGHNRLTFPNALESDTQGNRVSRFTSFGEEYGEEFNAAIDAYVATGQPASLDFRDYETHAETANANGLTYPGWLSARGLTLDDEDEGLWELWASGLPPDAPTP